MDKFEYKVRAEEIKSLIAQGDYVQAAELADGIDWRRVKSVMMLCTISDLYKINRRYEDAIELLLLAYDRHPGGRTIVYSLCELSIKMEEFVQAVEYYKEFVQIAPRDTGRYILQYKLYEAQDVSLEERIAVLEELKKRDYREKWAYELAYLYHRVGLSTRCVEECDELILWFGEGKYVTKAMELKMLHQPLTAQQQQRYDYRFQHKEEPVYEQPADDGSEDSRTYESSREYDAGQGYQDDQPYGNGQGYQDDQPYGNGQGYQDGQFYGNGQGYQDGQPYGNGQGYQDEQPYGNSQGYQDGQSYEKDQSYDEGQDYGSDQSCQNGEFYENDQPYQDVQHYREHEFEQNGRTYINNGGEKQEQEEEFDIQVKTMDVSQYNTINLQKELAEGLKEVLGEEPVTAEPMNAEPVTREIKTPVFENNTEQQEGGGPEGNKGPEEGSEPEGQEAEKAGEIMDDSADSKEQLKKLSEKEVRLKKLADVIAAETGGQPGAAASGAAGMEPQVTGQLSVEDILIEWETIRRDREETPEEADGVEELAEIEESCSEENMDAAFAEESLREPDCEVWADEEPEEPEASAEEELSAEVFLEESEEELQEEFPDETEEEELPEEFPDEAEGEELPEELLDEAAEEELPEELLDEAEEELPEEFPDEAEEEELPEELSDEAAEEELPEEFSDEAAEEELPEEFSDEAAEEELPEELSDEAEEEELSGESEEEPRAEKTVVREKPPVKEKLPEKERPSVEHEKPHVRNLTKEEKELFAPFIQNRAARVKLVAALDRISLAAYTGNVIITGDEGMDTLNLAKNMIRDVQMTDSNFSGKTAKISGAALNQKDAAVILEQLGNGALIIQKAFDINEKTADTMYKKLQQESLGIIVVIEDTRKRMDKFLAKNKKLAECFNARMDMEALSNEALVAFGKKYARNMEHSIDELGILALHTRIEDMQTIDHAVTIMEVQSIVDDAIKHAGRKTFKHFLDVLLAKRYDEEDMIILREDDFV